MRSFLAVFGAALSIAGAAAAQPCSDPEEISGSLTLPAERVEGKEVLARSAYSCGHFWSSANLMERAVAENGNALERFNLAATYARTGRYEAAAALYEMVASQGRFIDAQMDTAYVREGDTPQGFNLADEARRRLIALSYLRRLTQSSPAEQDVASNDSALDFGTNVLDTSRPAQADAFGVNVSDVTAGATVPDAVALARDGLPPWPGPLPR